MSAFGRAPRRRESPVEEDRRRGSKNKKSDRQAAIERASSLAELDRQGTSMGHIQINAARYLDSLAQAERAKPEPQLDLVVKYTVAAAKIAHDLSPWLYPTLQSIKLGGDDELPPIRMESLSDYQLEMLIKRLQRG
jgi:hypothetical protein